jgi:hypothetical protein
MQDLYVRFGLVVAGQTQRLLNQQAPGRFNSPNCLLLHSRDDNAVRHANRLHLDDAFVQQFRPPLGVQRHLVVGIDVNSDGPFRQRLHANNSQPNYMDFECRGRDSNPHALLGPRILSPPRLSSFATPARAAMPKVRV